MLKFDTSSEHTANAFYLLFVRNLAFGENLNYTLNYTVLARY